MADRGSPARWRLCVITDELLGRGRGRTSRSRKRRSGAEPAPVEPYTEGTVFLAPREDFPLYASSTPAAFISAISARSAWPRWLIRFFSSVESSAIVFPREGI
jgi:hypothetical protein